MGFTRKLISRYELDNFHMKAYQPEQLDSFGAKTYQLARNGR
jgi:hypothetical protein